MFHTITYSSNQSFWSSRFFFIFAYFCFSFVPSSRHLRHYSVFYSDEVMALAKKTRMICPNDTSAPHVFLGLYISSYVTAIGSSESESLYLLNGNARSLTEIALCCSQAQAYKSCLDSIPCSRNDSTAYPLYLVAVGSADSEAFLCKNDTASGCTDWTF